MKNKYAVELANLTTFKDETDDGVEFDFGEGYDSDDINEERQRWQKKVDELEEKLEDCENYTREVISG